MPGGEEGLSVGEVLGIALGVSLGLPDGCESD